MSKKKKARQSNARRCREMERLQETVEEQKASTPPIPPPSSSPSPPPPSLPDSPPPAPVEPVEYPGDQFWTEFEQANPRDKPVIFLRALEAHELDDEYAFEAIEAIRTSLDVNDAADRARYAELVEQLRQKAPDLYQESASYYHETLIRDAVADGRWEDLPELLAPFAEKPDLDMFYIVLDRLMYHGRIQPLVEAMTGAWPWVSTTSTLVPWASDEFASQLILLMLFDYLETAEAPRADDPALLESTTPYGEWNKDWLEQAIPRLTAPGPSSWRPEDFGEAVDADQWEDNLSNLLLDFTADQRRAGVPYGRVYMAQAQLAAALTKQFSMPAPPPRPRGKARYKKGKRSAQARPAAPTSSLVPSYQVMDKTLVELFPFLGAQPYKAVAVVELLPAYLHFLARLELIHPTQMDAALAELKPLETHISRAAASYGADPRAVDTLLAAWSKEALSALQDDPALAEARATPLAPPPPPPKPVRRPGALQTYTFKVTYLGDPDVWRSIEIAESQTLDDLHYAIQGAVDFDADHLYSFYMSGRAWDGDTEYSHPQADGPPADRVKIGALNLRMKQRFLYLFDYGDEHRFEVQLVDVNPDADEDETYPRVVKRHGKNPSQYGWDDEEWDEE